MALDTSYLLKYISLLIVSPVRLTHIRPYNWLKLAKIERKKPMTATVETAPVTGAKTQWKLDPMHTLVEFSAKHLMITTVKGRIADVEGTINVDERNPANSSVEATLKG